MPLRSYHENAATMIDVSIAPKPQKNAMMLNPMSEAPTTVVTQVGPSVPVGGMTSTIISATNPMLQKITGFERLKRMPSAISRKAAPAPLPREAMRCAEKTVR